MKPLFSYRATSQLLVAGLAALCVALLAFGLYLQHVVGLNPCPMCIVQRLPISPLPLFVQPGESYQRRKGCD